MQTKLPDWEPRTRLAALKTLTVQGSADYVRVTTGMAASLTQRALDEWQANDMAGGGEVRTIVASPALTCCLAVNILAHPASRT